MCKGELFCVVAMKEYGEEYPFLNSVLLEGELSALRSGRFTPEEAAIATY